MRPSYKRRKAAGLCVLCETPTQPNRVYCKQHLEQKKQVKNKYYTNKRQEILVKIRVKREGIKQQVYKYYGDKCQCCGQERKEFLQLDHINNDGYLHRKEIGADLALWCYRNNYPEGIQILCANCNWAKRKTGVCPHQYA